MKAFARRSRTIAAASLLLSAGGAAWGMPPLPPLPSPAGAMVRHAGAGIALDGFDPVGYFLAGRPVPGSPEFELVWQGVVWRFTSAANRALFAAAPEAYAPLLGGHDPAAAAAARLVEGDPGLFALVGGRLVLFRTEAGRSAVAADRAILAAAEAAWPELSGQLAR